MVEKVKEYVKALISDGRIDAFLGLLDQDGNIYPHLFEKVGDVDKRFTLGERDGQAPARYPMAKLVMALARNFPGKSFGVLIRGCDERALNELLRWNQITGVSDRIVKVGLACPQDLADSHECGGPFPEEFVAGDKAQPVTNAGVREVEALDLHGRLNYWRAEFDRCIKCYGCRDVCPVCFCNVCTLEEDALIRTGHLPPENPMFHLTRAVHMAGRCIDCNLCTEVCPARIPLRTLYKKVAEIVKDEFGYVTGLPGEGKSPLNILGPEPGHTSADE